MNLPNEFGWFGSSTAMFPGEASLFFCPLFLLRGHHRQWIRNKLDFRLTL
jgi:hypothetical protein